MCLLLLPVNLLCQVNPRHVCSTYAPACWRRGRTRQCLCSQIHTIAQPKPAGMACLVSGHYPSSLHAPPFCSFICNKKANDLVLLVQRPLQARTQPAPWLTGSSDSALRWRRHAKWRRASRGWGLALKLMRCLKIDMWTFVTSFWRWSCSPRDVLLKKIIQVMF